MKDKLKEYEDAGVDKTVFVPQAGKAKHEHICEALEYFADEDMEEFDQEESDDSGFSRGPEVPVKRSWNFQKTGNPTGRT